MAKGSVAVWWERNLSKCFNIYCNEKKIVWMSRRSTHIIIFIITSNQHYIPALTWDRNMKLELRVRKVQNRWRCRWWKVRENSFMNNYNWYDLLPINTQHAINHPAAQSSSCLINHLEFLNGIEGKTGISHPIRNHHSNFLFSVPFPITIPM